MANPLRNAMVYLGLAEDEQDYDAPVQDRHDRQAHTAVQNVPQAQQQSAPRGQVTPLRRTSTPRNAGTPEMNEILTVHPKQYKDAKVIAEQFREGVPVIMNLSQMSDTDARRLIDFASGLAEGLYGKIERVTNKVFLLSPSHVLISGETGAADVDVEASF